MIRHADGTVEFNMEVRGEGRNAGLEKRRIMLNSWAGCSDTQQEELTMAWKNMLQMADEIKGKVNFDEMVASDFLGSKARNAANQKDIRGLIEGVTMWQLGGVLDWHLAMKCNDFSKKKVDIGASPGDGCPPGTPKEDYDKCGSRCWRAKKNDDGTVREWVYKALAYSENWKSVHVGAINWCPGWFAQKSCVDRLHTFGNNVGASKWDLINYQCREQAMVHELFHLDAHSKFVSGAGHVFDRNIKVRGPNGQPVTVQVYGPLYTKVLANFLGKDVGKFVATNADSLAQYFLAKWIQVHAGFYPDKPRTQDKPLSRPTDSKARRDVTPDVYDPIQIVDGQVAQGDPNDLANALGDNDVADAPFQFVYQDEATDCEDLISDSDEDVDAPSVCYTTDDDKNNPLDLDGSIPFPLNDPEAESPTSSFPVPEPTPTPPPREDLACADPGKNAAAYVAAQSMEDAANDFCDKEINGGAAGEYGKPYNEDTYEGVRISLKSSVQISSDVCKDHFKRIIHGCAPAANNPMNWKCGGELDRDDSHYTISPSGSRATNRKNDNGAPMQSVIAKCDSFYQAVQDEFWIYGAGFMGKSFGSELLDQMRNCVGGGVTDWSFEYYDKPGDDGMEWKAFGHAPIWQKNCFSPVIKGVGGPDVPCNGSG